MRVCVCVCERERERERESESDIKLEISLKGQTDKLWTFMQFKVHPFALSTI